MNYSNRKAHPPNRGAFAKPDMRAGQSCLAQIGYPNYPWAEEATLKAITITAVLKSTFFIVPPTEPAIYAAPVLARRDLFLYTRQVPLFTTGQTVIQA
jgi:hypothetical protein